MEELTVEALLASLGYGSAEEYQRVLNNLWETTSGEYDSFLLELESRKYKDAMIYLLHRSPAFFDSGKEDVFGKILMKRLRAIYEQIPLDEFGRLAYSVWRMLPETINSKEPFFTMNYADDCLSYGNEQQCRELYEKMFSYFDKK